MQQLCGLLIFRHFTAVSFLVVLFPTMHFWKGTEGRVTGNSV